MVTAVAGGVISRSCRVRGGVSGAVISHSCNIARGVVCGFVLTLPQSQCKGYSK